MEHQNTSSIGPADALPGSDQVLGVGRRADPCQVGHGVQEHNRASRHTEGFEGVEKDVGEVGKRGSSRRRTWRHSPSPPVGRDAGNDWSDRMKTAGDL